MDVGGFYFIFFTFTHFPNYRRWRMKIMRCWFWLSIWLHQRALNEMRTTNDGGDGDMGINSRCHIANDIHHARNAVECQKFAANIILSASFHIIIQFAQLQLWKKEAFAISSHKMKQCHHTAECRIHFAHSTHMLLTPKMLSCCARKRLSLKNPDQEHSSKNQRRQQRQHIAPWTQWTKNAAPPLR